MTYLQVILKRYKNELLKRVYLAQKINPTKGDYSKLVNDDYSKIYQEINEDAIIAMSEFQYKNYIKKHIKQAAFEHLKDIQKSHSKVRDIKYDKFMTQPYLTSSTFRNSEAIILSALRSHTLRGFKSNFSSWYKPNLMCPLSNLCNEEDTQRHMLSCKALLAELKPEHKQLINSVEYEDIYGSTEAQMRAVNMFTILLEIREGLQQAATPASGSSLVATPLPGGDGGC